MFFCVFFGGFECLFLKVILRCMLRWTKRTFACLRSVRKWERKQWVNHYVSHVNSTISANKGTRRQWPTVVELNRKLIHGEIDERLFIITNKKYQFLNASLRKKKFFFFILFYCFYLFFFIVFLLFHES